jgi:hypothetical protein
MKWDGNYYEKGENEKNSFPESAKSVGLVWGWGFLDFGGNLGRVER